jgi:DNA-binding transcriptional LysR family regulator
MSSHNPFGDIALFLRVVELGSIRAAAREAGLEPSSVSRKVAALERRLKSKLLDRTQAKSHPTDAGERYYQQMRLLLPQIEAVESGVSGEAAEPKGLLRVNAPIDFGQRHVTQWLLDFRKQYPKVDVQLTLSSNFVDLITEGIDIAIRVGQLKDSALKARKLADVPRVLVASPAYLASRGTPMSPAELSQHEHVFFSPANRQHPLLLTGPDGSAYQVERHGGVTINAVHSVVRAVEDGFGIHAGPRWAFYDALQKGSVVELLPDYHQPVMPMNALWSPAVMQPARVRAFIDFIRDAALNVKGLVFK